MGSWFDCDDCVFATNSPKEAAGHEKKTGHHVTEEEED